MQAVAVKKQSLCDWQITKCGKAYAWVTKQAGSTGLYVLTFKEFGKSVDYTFRYFKEAVAFAKTFEGGAA